MKRLCLLVACVTVWTDAVASTFIREGGGATAAGFRAAIKLASGATLSPSEEREFFSDEAAPLEYLLLQIDRWRDGSRAPVRPVVFRGVSTPLSRVVNELVAAGAPGRVDRQG